MTKEDRQETTIIIRKVPVELHRLFKVACAQEGVTQQDKVLELIKNYISQKGKEKKR